MSANEKKAEGIGLGLRVDMAARFLDEAPESVRWVEVHPENYIGRGGLYRSYLDRARERWPVLTHGLSTCLGDTEALDTEYMGQLRGFLGEVGTGWHSEHLCFGSGAGAALHDLLPLPFTDEAARTAADRFGRVRDAIDLEFAFENVSYYAPQGDDGLDEARFCAEVLERTGGKMLLDVNNVYVNSRNFGFDPRAFIDLVPPDRVVQMHVAGHFVRDDGLRIDTHGEPVCDDVYELLGYALRHVGPVPVLLERDNDIPPLEDLLAEVERLTRIYDDAMRARETGAEVHP
ncbi:MAG: hypothetical protein CMN30_19040 [Sandaracinus sp.]|nr:hypothetical protein [Sandaracinus sp.]|tara:strand:- start:1991 stop:2857 length:867 start_codon:yes stop_codon:yes gene_type:complete